MRLTDVDFEAIEQRAMKYQQGVGIGTQALIVGSIARDTLCMLQELKEVREALRKYGEHSAGCRAYDGRTLCNCGFRRALGLEP